MTSQGNAEEGHVSSRSSYNHAITTLRSMCNDASFDPFWQEITASAEGIDVNQPALSRHCKRLLTTLMMPIFHVAVDVHYRIIYFEALYLISCIEDRFQQPGCQTYEKFQTLLFKAAAAEPYEMNCNSCSLLWF